MKKIVFAIAITISATVSVQAETSDKWRSGYGQGVSEYWVKSKNNDTFMLTCDHGGAIGGGPGANISINGKGPTAGSLVTVKITEKHFQLFFNKNQTLNTDCHACADNWVGLWAAIRKGKSLQVVYSNGVTANFSLASSEKVIPAEACRPKFYD